MEKGCPNCGRMIEAKFNRCPYCNYDFSQLNGLFKQYEEEMAIKVPKYAGFIKRVVANTLDFWFLFIIISIIQIIYLYFLFPDFFNNYSFLDFSYKDIIMFIPYLCLPIIYFFYCVFSQHSKAMATLGERFLKLEVINTYEEPITWGEAFGRNIGRILNLLTLGIGFLMIIFTKQKQALNDMVSHTMVINKVTDENYNGFSYAHLFKRLLAFIIDLVILALIAWGFQYLQSWLSMTYLEYQDELMSLMNVLLWLILVIYFPLLEAKMQGSFGKKLLKIKVARIDGEKVGFIRALCRFVLLIMELLLVPFAVLLPFVTPRKQTIKDMVTKTIVVNTY